MSANIMHVLSADALAIILQTKFECETLDFKESLDLNNRRDLVEFARDVLAMANTLGGYIIVGVQDKTFKVVGVQEQHVDLLREGAKVNAKLHPLLRRQVTVHAAVHDVPDEDGDVVPVAMLFVSPSEHMIPAPEVGSYQHHDNGKVKDKTAFAAGDVLIRKSDTSTKPLTPEDLKRRPYDPNRDFLQFQHPVLQPAEEFANPYNIAVVARQEMFKGREQECEKLLLYAAGGSHSAVYGLQRAGKSSLVHKVFRDQVQSDPRYRDKIRFAAVELQEIGTEYITQRQFLSRIVEGICSAVAGTMDDREVRNSFVTYLEDSDHRKSDRLSLFEGFTRAVELILSRQELNVVLFIDEFSEVCRSIERVNQLQSKSQKYNPQSLHPSEVLIDVPFMKQFSSLLKSARLQRKLTFVLAVRPFLAEYDRTRDLQILKLMKSITVYYLSEAAAKALITDPIKGHLKCTDEAVDYLYRLTAGHPYLIQFFMLELVDNCMLSGLKSISVGDIKAFEDQLITRGAQYQAQFDILDSDYSVEEVVNPLVRDLGRGTLALISMLGTQRKEGWVEELEIKEELAKHGVFTRAASEILSKLQESEIITRSSQHGPLSLRVTVPLLRKRYVAQNMYQQYFPDQHKN